MKRRSFFQAIAKAAAIVALAPQLAFRVKAQEIVAPEWVPIIEYKANAIGIYAQLQACGKLADENADIPKVLEQSYQLHIECNSDTIGVITDEVGVAAVKAIAAREALTEAFFAERRKSGWIIS